VGHGLPGLVTPSAAGPGGFSDGSLIISGEVRSLASDEDVDILIEILTHPVKKTKKNNAPNA